MTEPWEPGWMPGSPSSPRRGSVVMDERWLEGMVAFVTGAGRGEDGAAEPESLGHSHGTVLVSS